MRWFRSWKARPSFFYVVSHERSGTHFLINSIKLNTKTDLKYQSIGEWFGPFDRPDTQFEHIQKKRKSLNPKNYYVLKSHCDRALFNKIYPKGKTIYIFRDYRDVLVSYFHFLQEGYLDWFRKYNSSTPEPWFTDFSSFLRQPLPECLRLNYSLCGDFYDPCDRWINHVAQWIDNPPENSRIVTYNQLHKNTEEITKSLLDFLGIPSKESFIHPNFENAYTVMPRKGIVGDWKNYFSQEDIDFVESKISENGVLIDLFS